MEVLYRNKPLERLLILLNASVTAAVAGTALAQLGFYEHAIPDKIAASILIWSTVFFIAEKIIRFFNSRSKKDYLATRWFELLFVLVFVVLLISANFMLAMGVYLLVEIIAKICRTVVNLAASGKSPAVALAGLFILLILCGAALLMLPKSHTDKPLSFVDALFTAASATCVTGLTVKETGIDFTLVGQTIILSLIQIGGLGIVIFGAVFALLFGQSLGVRQATAMQDLLSAQTVNKIANMIAFIFIATIGIEFLGAAYLYNMWDSAFPMPDYIKSKWFCSLFHSVSAFCNAGFSLFSKNLVEYSFNWRVYGVICPLIIFGGLGFGVLRNLFDIFSDRAVRILKNIIPFAKKPAAHLPQKMHLQTRVVLFVTSLLIIFGTVFLLVIQNNTGNCKINLGDAFFQSVSARTAGFNTIDINALSEPAKMILIILMFIGGSPGSTAGGIKTVTLAIIVMAVYATIRKRADVEMFKRSIPLVAVGKAFTVLLLFAVMFFTSGFLLTITERHNNFATSAIFFETASALGTVGLSCGITPSLTTAGKLIIIITMLIGRLGALTLLATLTFNIKPKRYNYPIEPIIVG
ncbi:MAG TPA: ATPase [Phycisphaerales bacterium]|nr:ATPase [Phycisphaerales bacterium]HBR20923.1 ATPase [Phycisphaerales bacterium]